MPIFERKQYTFWIVEMKTGTDLIDFILIVNFHNLIKFTFDISISRKVYLYSDTTSTLEDCEFWFSLHTRPNASYFYLKTSTCHPPNTLRLERIKNMNETYNDVLLMKSLKNKKRYCNMPAWTRYYIKRVSSDTLLWCLIIMINI